MEVWINIINFGIIIIGIIIIGLLFYNWNKSGKSVKRSHLVKRLLFSREKEKETERGKGQKENQRTKVEGRRSLELRGCRINSGKGGLSSINGYYGMICTG